MSAPHWQNSSLTGIKLTGQGVPREDAIAILEKNRNARDVKVDARDDVPCQDEDEADDDVPELVEQQGDEFECAEEFECADDYLLGQDDIDKIVQKIDECSTVIEVDDADTSVGSLFSFGYLSLSDKMHLDTRIYAKYKYFRANHPEQFFARDVARQESAPVREHNDVEMELPWANDIFKN